MEAIKRALDSIKGFVDEFANSGSHIDSTPRPRENAPAWYAEWDDNYMEMFINNALTKACLQKVADKYYGSQLEDILARSTELSEDSFPMLFAVYNECCLKLGMHQQPKTYITGVLSGINALSVEVKGKKLILISRMVAIRLTPDEQAFLLGHEISHHQQGNLACHTVTGLLETLNDPSAIIGPIIADTVEVPLKRWCRCSEFNADRAGLICCEDINVVEGLFKKLGMQPRLSAYSEYNEVSAAHPHLQTRLAVLSRYKITAKPNML